ncbi:MAG: DNA polymerase Y family protein [Alphaproteobacteria bacterium]|nr:DNA polymerase Y family protein [Alphaproteobacteria bacterium]
MSSSTNKFIYMWFYDLPPWLACQQQGWAPDIAVAIYRIINTRQVICHASASAKKAGIMIHMSVADAQAILPICHFREYDDIAVKNWLSRVGEWAWRYTPIVGIDSDSLGIWLNVTGASHLGGGIKAVCNRLHTEFNQIKVSVQIAAAPTYGAAWAFAHFSELLKQPNSQQNRLVIACDERSVLRQKIQPLPIAALRISTDIEAGLRQAGLQQIYQLWAISAISLTTRFGSELVQRLGQIIGDVNELQNPLIVPTPLIVSKNYLTPLLGVEAIQQMIADLVRLICIQLAQRYLLTRHLVIAVQRTDSTIIRRTISLSRPSRSESLLHRLTAHLAANIDAEFGIEHSWIEAKKLSAGLPVNQAFDSDLYKDDSKETLIDYLTARLGPNKVCQLRPSDSWQPESAQKLQPAQQTMQPASSSISNNQSYWQLQKGANILDNTEYNTSLVSFSARPLSLLTPAIPLHVIALLPDHPPSMIRWRKQNWHIYQATGPERIGPSWWQHITQTSPYSNKRKNSNKTRDYYWLETRSGERLWVYREGLTERGENVEWFLHGFFA